MKKRILSTLLALCMVLTLLPGWAEAAETSGSCGKNGNNVTWSFNAARGTLTLTGSGETDSYGPEVFEAEAPWTEYADQIKTIYVQGTITALGIGLFETCTSATGIMLPKTLERIDLYALPYDGRMGNHSALAYFITDDNSGKFFSDGGILYERTSSGVNLFYYPPAIQHPSYALRSETKYIASDPSDNERFHGYGFRTNHYIKKVELNNGLQVIGTDAFKGCTALTDVNIPNGVTTIKDEAFAFCTSLKNISLPSSLTSLDLCAFHGCDAMDTLIVPASVRTVDCSVMYEVDTNFALHKDIYFRGAAPTGEIGPWLTNENGYVRTDVYYPENAAGWSGFIASAKNSSWSQTFGTDCVKFHPYSLTPEEPEPVAKYMVSFDLNGGVGRVPSPYSYEVDTDVFIPSEIPTREGYVFVGWTDGTTIYQPKKSVRVKDRDIVLRAVWDIAPTLNELTQRFIQIARGLVGKTGESFGFSTDWCVSFVDLCARDPQVKIPTAIIPSCSGTGTLLGTTGTSYYFDDWEYELASQKWDNYLKDALKVERFNPELGTGFVPQNGDLVFIRWKNNNKRYPPHVGIVCDVDTQRHTMTIIDGNAGPNGYLRNKVKVRTGIDYTAETISSMDNCTLMAYARPNWNEALPVSSGEVYGLLKCPINVSISYNNEELNSATGQLVTSFGTMSVGDTGDGIAFHLNNYYDAETVITGTGTGTMDFSITYVDDDGTSNSRVFQGVPITNDMIIEVEDNNNTAGEVLLKIFRNHGNTFVEAWQAISEEPVMGPNTDLTNWYLENKEPESVIPVSPSNPTQSSITVPTTPGGKITPSINFPSPGDWVTLTATPDAGYELASLTVTTRYGQNVPVTALGDGRYAFTMPDSEVTVSAVFSKAESSDAGPLPGAGAGYGGYADIVYPGPAMAFTDVQPGDWFYDSVNYVYTRRLMNGVSAAAFDPQGTTSRAMIWTVLARLSGRDTTGGASWYERGQIWAMDKGITDGTAPEGSVTREQLVTMLWRFKGSPYSSGSLASFADGAQVSPYASGAVTWAVGGGLLKGDAGRLNPQGTATRAEVAAILQRFCQNNA